MSDMIKHVSDTTFDKDVLQSANPVLVDFWAEWCGPCKMFAPVLDEVAKAYEGKLTVAKLDIDANPATPGKFGIRGIPTVILYKDGRVEDISKASGNLDIRSLSETVTKHYISYPRP